MAYDPEMGGDTAPLLAAFNDGFAGHVRNDVTIAYSLEPGQLPHVPRATIVILLDPNNPSSRCGVVDLLHPSERNTPRCGHPECRCMAHQMPRCGITSP